MTTKGSDWEKLNRIFDGALQLSPAMQGAYLTDVCDGDEDLLREAQAILNASDRAAKQDFLEADAFAVGAKILAIDSVDDVTVGKTIGNYKIIKEIGRGGMGAIYLAMRDDFQRRVALKVIKRGMDTDEIVRRFEQEREVLAALNHPNIAKLLDGGTTGDGLPFLVMEYVEGSPLTAYADENALNLDERLSLFRKICSAVAYAHQNLIVHRDLKPSNILVDGEGEPKLLDFGIAKLLTPERSGQTTETGFRLLTPEYASPEQIRGERITTSSDVYSLGVLLYELLTGKKPYQIPNRNAAEIMRVVCETAPERPSSVVPVSSQWRVVETTHRSKTATKPYIKVTRSLKGDLDNIILKALQKDPVVRYSSVEQLADDIDRYLSGLPVTARRATFNYQFAKFVERNRTAVAFASIAFVAVLAGSSIAVWQAVVASSERSRAENRLTEIRRLTGNLVSGWDKDIPETQITSLVRGRIADISSEYLEGLANETNDPAILNELADAYLKLGHEYSWQEVNAEKAKLSFQKAESIARILISADKNNIGSKDLLVRSLAKYDEFFGNQDRAASLKNHFERLKLREEIVAQNPYDETAIKSLANEIHNCGWILNLTGNRAEAIPYYSRSAEIAKQLIGWHEPIASTVDERRKVEKLYSFVAMNYLDIGDLPLALENSRIAAQISDDIYRQEPENRDLAIEMTATHQELGTILKKVGDIRASNEALSSGLKAAHEQNLRSRGGYFVRKESDLLLELAENQHELGNDKAAYDTVQESISVWRKYHELEINLENSRNFRQIADLKYFAGKLLMRMRKFDHARTFFSEAEAHYKNSVDINTDPFDKGTFANLYLTMGDLEANAGVCDLVDSPVVGISSQRQYCPSDIIGVPTNDRSRLVRSKKYYESALGLLIELKEQNLLVFDDSENLRIAAEKIDFCDQKLANK